MRKFNNNAKFLLGVMFPKAEGLGLKAYYTDDALQAGGFIEKVFEICPSARVSVWTKENGAENWYINLKGELVVTGPVVPDGLKKEDVLLEELVYS